MLAVDGRIDSTDYRAFEKIYTNQMEVRDMFATAMTEKDKRLIEEGEAKGKEKGKAEGKVEGKKEERDHIAKQMKLKGFSLSDISDITGLKPEEIDTL